MKKKRKISISLAFKLFLVMIFTVMLIIILHMSYIANHSLMNLAAENNQTTLSFYRDRVDQSLTDLDRYMYDFIYNNTDALSLIFESDEMERCLAKIGISESLNQIVKLHNIAEGVFFYSPLSIEEDYITRTSHVLSLSESNALQKRTLEIINAFQRDNHLNTSKWFVDQIDGKHYLMRIIYVNDSYCGAWVSAKELTDTLENIGFGEGIYTFLCSTDGVPLTETDTVVSFVMDNNNWSTVEINSTQFIQINVESMQCEYSVVAVIPVKGITEQWENGFQYVFMFALMFIVILVAILLCGNYLYKSFKVFVNAMEEVEKGNLDGRITKKTRLMEFDHMYKVFNSMVFEIKTLKINIYEQRSKDEKITRQYLQMQLKSHFFLNCLNIIYSLAQMKSFELIQKLTICLVKYFRYIMKDTGKFAVMEDEIYHIRNYMNIQKLRFPDMVEFYVEIEDSCMKTLVPPLMLQTFIENSIEHAINFEQNNEIYLRVKKEIRNDMEGIFVTISDNGKGFSEQFIAAFNKGEAEKSLKASKGIGIRNIKNRLRLLYDSKAELVFKNNIPHGAKIEIWLPDQKVMEKKEVS